VTLALALRGSNGLVLGTDSRVTAVEINPTTGLPQQTTRDTSEKFLQVNRDIGVLTYGLAEPGYGGISRLAEDAKRNRYPSFQAIETAAQGIFTTQFDTWAVAQPDPTQARQGLVGFILAGYDSVLTNQFKVTSFESSNTFSRTEIVSPAYMAAQWHIGQYLAGKLQYPEMTVEQLKPLAVFFMLETMSIEATVGGPIQLATVTLRTGFQRVTEDEIEALVTACQPKIQRLRRILLEL